MLVNNITLFCKIVEKGSLVGAAREMGLSTTRVSERLATLEAHYGVVLLNRTTRSLSLTQEGRALMDGARVVLNEIDDLDSRIRHGAQTLTGLIRISAPSDLGRVVVAPELDRFIEDHPNVSVELLLSDGYVDIVGAGIDIAIRFGHITDSSLRARSLGKKRRLICASPDYLKNHGVPMKPIDLKSHNCLLMRFGENIDNVWRLGTETMQQIVTVSGDRISNDGALIRQWCLDGQGLALKSELDVGPDIRAGKLVRVLTDYAPPIVPLQMLFPPNRAQPRRIGVLAEQLSSAFESLQMY